MTWTYALDGRETRVEGRNSIAKWEGAALLINTLVSAPENHTVMDRWQLSADRATLTITRQMVRARGEAEGRLVYRRAGRRSEETPAPERRLAAALARRPRRRSSRGGGRAGGNADPVGAGELVEHGEVARGRPRVPSDGGSGAAGGRIVIPPGSTVTGTITATKPSKGKRDLYIRFDSLSLADGTTRDLRSRPDGGKEGKVAGETDGAKEARKVATGAGIGASIGSIAGAAGGHAGAGAGIGGLAGAAAGLGSVLSKRQDITLRAGTQVEMALDRDLRF